MTVSVSKPAINVREKLAELDKPTGIAGEAMLRAKTPQEQFNLIGAGRRNLIINGDCRISQRGDFSSLTNMADETYYIDRFEMNFSGVSGQKKHNASPSDLPDGMTGDAGTFYYKASSSATGFLGCRQTIEAYKVFDGRAFTASAYIKTNHPSVRFYLYNGTTAVAGNNTIPNDGQWHRLEETFNFDASAGSKMQIEIIALSEAGSAVSITSGDYVEFTGLQVELGKVATPFEHRSYGEELALCQRYYYRVGDMTAGDRVGSAFASTSSSAQCFLSLPTTMRVNPTGSYSGAAGWSFASSGGSYTASALTLSPNKTGSLVTLTISGATAGYGGQLRATSSTSTLSFDAEL